MTSSSLLAILRSFGSERTVHFLFFISVKINLLVSGDFHSLSASVNLIAVCLDFLLRGCATRRKLSLTELIFLAERVLYRYCFAFCGIFSWVYMCFYLFAN